MSSTRNKKIDIPSIKKINRSKKKYTAMSFFAGCGGSSTGYKMAGYDVLYANEFVPIARDTYEANAAKHTVVDGSDIRQVNMKALMRKLDVKPGELDLLDGSPPCLAFSTAGKGSDIWGEEVSYSEGIRQRVDDLFFEFIRVLKVVKPKTFVAENVVGLSNKEALGYLKEIITDFRSCGYKVEAKLIDPALLGAPQRRTRLIIIGIRNDLAKKEMGSPFPVPRKGLIGVRDHLPNIAYIKRSSGSNVEFVCASSPSPTIVASDHTTGINAKFGCGGWVETVEGEQRKYTIEELKKIFTFPDDFVLLGNFKQQWERLGRSHLPLATYEIGNAIARNVLTRI